MPDHPDIRINALAVERLTKAAFAPFGDVVEIEGAEEWRINQGFGAALCRSCQNRDRRHRGPADALDRPRPAMAAAACGSACSSATRSAASASIR